MKSAAATGAVAMGAQAFAAARTRPNILFIMVDDLGFGDLACYGAPDMRTPHIDALVARGMRFDRAYANCPVCSPTRAAFLSGRYPDMAGVPGVVRTHWTDNFGFLRPDIALLPNVLQDAGYDTALIGKWHLGLESPNTPNERGFDFFHGFLGDMMDDYYDHRRHDINYMRRDQAEIDPEGHATDLFTDWSIDYLRDQARSSDPFFLFLSYNAPHTPIHPPPAWLEKVKQREPAMADDRAGLVALIEHLDDGIGRVYGALDETGLAENTLIVFTSDNGGFLRVGARNDPCHGGKGMMFEGGIRVPACAVWPGRIEAGSVSDHIFMTMDWFPALCEVADAAAPEIDGVSIMPVLRGESVADAERTLFWVRREGGEFGGRAFYAARRGPWKLLQNTPFEPMRLYNLDDDPEEQQPLDSAHPMYGELFGALRNHVIRAGAVPWEPPGVRV